MAKQLLIKAKNREDKKSKELRREGFVPATLYGHGIESKSIQVNAKEFSLIPHRAYSHINKLEIEGEKEPHDILIKNVQTDPIRDFYQNIEFYQINKNEKVRIRVPINYTGHSPAIVAGGMLVVSHNDLEIQCLPKDIPDGIDINLEEIKEIGQSILTKNVKFPEGVVPLTNPNEVLVKVEIPKTHEVEEAKPAEAAATTDAATAAKPEDAKAGAKPADKGKPEAGKKEEKK